MLPFIILALVGGLLIFFGILNCRGNLTPLHSYHYHRVTEADRLKFGRRVGLGTILIGGSVILYGVLLFAYEKTQKGVLLPLGLCFLFAGLAVGMAITFHAMKKYNKGIF